MSPRRLLVLVVLLALPVVLWPGSADAHQFGLSLVEYQVGDQDVSAQINVDLRHLDMAVGVDQDRNRRITEDELMASRDAIYGYLTSRMTISGNADPCQPSFEKLMYDAARTAGVMWIRYQCDSPLGTVEIVNKAFREQPGNHQWVAVIAEEGRRHRVVFNKQHTTATYQATPPEAPEVVEQTDESVRQEGLWTTVADYVWLGVEHILLGFDHVLFILTLIFVARRFRQLISYVTAFTIAHSLTLALAALDVISPPGSIVEPLIAATILFVAVENILREHAREASAQHRQTTEEEPRKTKEKEDLEQKTFLGLQPEPRGRALLVFGFGLIHGFGFAGVLADLGLPTAQLIPALVSFNIGVELGQLAVVLASWPLLHHAMKRRGYPRFVQIASAAVGLVATWWLIQRTLLT